MKNSKIYILMLLLVLPVKIFSQSTSQVEMADVLRSNGKIYVVVVGLLIILTGLIIFLVRVDRKLTKLEKQIEKKN